jgi:hypothetical protein
VSEERRDDGAEERAGWREIEPFFWLGSAAIAEGEPARREEEAGNLRRSPREKDSVRRDPRRRVSFTLAAGRHQPGARYDFDGFWF